MNGSTELRSKDVALVVEREEGYAFEYFPGESNDTVWPGNQMKCSDTVVSASSTWYCLLCTVNCKLLSEDGIFQSAHLPHCLIYSLSHFLHSTVCLRR